MARYTGQAAVDDEADAGNRERRFGDVGGGDDAAQLGWSEDAILLTWCEITVQHEQGERVAAPGDADFVERALNFAHAGQEDEHVTGGGVGAAGVTQQAQRFSGCAFRDRPIVIPFLITDIHGEAAAGGFEDRTPEILRDRFGFERGRHDDQAQVRAAGLDAPAECQRHVTHQIAFVEFVEQDYADVREERVALQPAQQDALGDVCDARAWAEAFVEAHLIADDVPDGAIHFEGDAHGDAAGSDAARLQHDDELLAGDAVCKQHLRNLRRFAGSGWRDEHERSLFAPHERELRAQVVDREHGMDYKLEHP